MFKLYDIALKNDFFAPEFNIINKIITKIEFNNYIKNIFFF